MTLRKKNKVTSSYYLVTTNLSKVVTSISVDMTAFIIDFNINVTTVTTFKIGGYI